MLTDLFHAKKNGTSNGKHVTKAAPVSADSGVAAHGVVRAEWREITPMVAQVIIDQQNTQNRKHRDGRVRALARAMERGTFRLTHQAIAFDRNGVLIDGQHRLRAIVTSGTTQTILVVEGLDPIARAATDIGAARTPADMLKIVGGEDRAPLVAKALGAIRRSVFKTTERLDWDETDELRRFFADGLEWAVANVGKAGKHTSGPVVGALVFAYRKHPDLVKSIYHELETGAVTPGDLLLPFRDLLLGSALHGERFNGEIFAKLLTVIWHRAHGRKINKLFATAEALTYFEKAYG